MHMRSDGQQFAVFRHPADSTFDFMMFSLRRDLEFLINPDQRDDFFGDFCGVGENHAHF